jgi:Uncharacterized protein conserved in bacteria (DUF2252)
MPTPKKSSSVKVPSRSKQLSDQFTAPRPSVADRMESGKRLRTTVPKASLAEHQPPKNRKDPVAILEAQAKSRIQGLIPVRYARMLQSPFAFLRGTAAAMAQDLSPSPVTGLQVQLCGDMHVSNFGVFASPERSLIFGINDFDETIPGPWEWDLKRLAASAVVAGQFIGKDHASCETYSRAIVSSYRKRIREFAETGYLATWYSAIREEDILAAVPPKLLGKWQKGIEKAKKGSHLQVLEKMTDLIDNKQRIVENAPFVVRETKTDQGVPISRRYRNVPGTISRLVDRGPETSHLALSGPRRSPKGSRRGQRRDTLLDSVHARQGRRRSAIPAI